MKLGLFTDSHYCSREGNCKSLKKIDKALNDFEKKECDLVVFLGDLVDKEEDHETEIANLKQISDVMNKYNLKISVLIGNHDTYNFSKDDFYRILGEKYRPQNLCINKKNFLFIDSCHSKTGISYKPGFCDWSDIFFPHTDMLEQTLLHADGHASYIFTHHNLDPAVIERHRISNAAEIRSILEKSKKVHTVFQGHHHHYIESEFNGIHYVTYPSMLENEDAYYIVEL